jgi:hypothetical protein
MNDAKIDEAVEIICKDLHSHWWELSDNEVLKSLWSQDVKNALLKALPLLKDEKNERR